MAHPAVSCNSIDYFSTHWGQCIMANFSPQKLSTSSEKPQNIRPQLWPGFCECRFSVWALPHSCNKKTALFCLPLKTCDVVPVWKQDRLSGIPKKRLKDDQLEVFFFFFFLSKCYWKQLGWDYVFCQVKARHLLSDGVAVHSRPCRQLWLNLHV